MKGAPIENVKKAVLAFLSTLSQYDYFNIIAFNTNSHSFSSSMELATNEALQLASEWINEKLVPEGDTNILLPVKQVLNFSSNLILYKQFLCVLFCLVYAGYTISCSCYVLLTVKLTC